MKNITVIGSGTMGNGIAHVFAQFGYSVNLVDISEPALQKALATIAKNIDRQVDSIKNEVRKYIKREKSKRPPEGFNFWAFDCKFGKTAEEATEIKFVDVTKSIDFAVSEDYDSFYLELVARADVKRVKEKNQEVDEEEELED